MLNRTLYMKCDGPFTDRSAAWLVTFNSCYKFITSCLNSDVWSCTLLYNKGYIWVLPDHWLYVNFGNILQSSDASSYFLTSQISNTDHRWVFIWT